MADINTGNTELDSGGSSPGVQKVFFQLLSLYSFTRNNIPAFSILSEYPPGSQALGYREIS